MHHPLQLAYLGLEVPDPSTLTRSSPTWSVSYPAREPRRARWRGATTTRHSRVIVEAGPANDAEFIGFDAGDDGALDAFVARLDTSGFAASAAPMTNAPLGGSIASCERWRRGGLP